MQTPAERVRAKLKVMLDKATASGEPGGGIEASPYGGLR